ncbi:hypothetical protein FIV42_29020 [Persicimonas caeni]|uniref:DUF839 domain-containing protein n=1 Tax=Persicimonas caeni TaxID=2292766 RepID=A0A4Y6Q209_PERCE|nr:hypothetical protein [Persicimonas caeni]QDG54641.1 hypothetical protein FIV42_29020 [Persicimonas caeni]QED35862.1 hypothetical protein FRD00_29015 [Persicimonas caeni]
MSNDAMKRCNAWLLRAGAAAALTLSPLVVTGCSDDGGGETEQDASVNPDAGDVPEGDGTSSNNTTPEPEDYYISYLIQDKTGAGETSLHVYSTADQTHTQVSPEGHDCAQPCWLTEDMSSFVWAENNANADGTVDVYAASVSDLKVQDDGRLIAEGVSKPSVNGNTVSYRRGSSGPVTAYYVSVDGGDETEIGSLGNTNATVGGWHIDPSTNQGMIFAPSLQTMDLRFGSLGGPITDTAFTVNAENYQQTSGSYFGESMPVGFSRDGKIAAFVTEAPNDYGECETAADCSGPGQRCGHQGRCTAYEVTVHFVDLENLGDLGGACGGPGTCGDIHECYQPGADTTTARCIPKRVVVGLPADLTQANQTGCELTEGNEDYHYTRIRGPLTFDNGGNLYAVGTRDCSSGDAGDSDILKFDPASGEYDVVWGNPDTGYDPGLCWDNDAMEPDDAQCVPYIKSARVSPEANEIAFLATNPGVAEGRLAPETMDLWTVLRNGEEHAWVGGHDYVLKNVTRLYVHPAQ